MLQIVFNDFILYSNTKQIVPNLDQIKLLNLNNCNITLEVISLHEILLSSAIIKMFDKLFSKKKESTK